VAFRKPPMTLKMVLEAPCILKFQKPAMTWNFPASNEGWTEEREAGTKF
jgi:hypothetical protein